MFFKPAPFLLATLFYLCIAGNRPINNHLQYSEAMAAPDFNWLLGTWKMSLKNAVLYEEWKLEDKNYVSRSYKVSPTGDTALIETARIVYKDGATYYVPTTASQNNQQPVDFKMTGITATGFVAENPAHDFPQKITYQLKENGSLYVLVDGKIREQYRKQEFLFTK